MLGWVEQLRPSFIFIEGHVRAVMKRSGLDQRGLSSSWVLGFNANIFLLHCLGIES